MGIPFLQKITASLEMHSPVYDHSFMMDAFCSYFYLFIMIQTIKLTFMSLGAWPYSLHILLTPWESIQWCWMGSYSLESPSSSHLVKRGGAEGSVFSISIHNSAFWTIRIQCIRYRCTSRACRECAGCALPLPTRQGRTFRTGRMFRSRTCWETPGNSPWESWHTDPANRSLEHSSPKNYYPRFCRCWWPGFSVGFPWKHLWCFCHWSARWSWSRWTICPNFGRGYSAASWLACLSVRRRRRCSTLYSPPSNSPRCSNTCFQVPRYAGNFLWVSSLSSVSGVLWSWPSACCRSRQERRHRWGRVDSWCSSGFRWTLGTSGISCSGRRSSQWRWRRSAVPSNTCRSNTSDPADSIRIGASVGLGFCRERLNSPKSSALPLPEALLHYFGFLLGSRGPEEEGQRFLPWRLWWFFSRRPSALPDLSLNIMLEVAVSLNLIDVSCCFDPIEFAYRLSIVAFQFFVVWLDREMMSAHLETSWWG